MKLYTCEDTPNCGRSFLANPPVNGRLTCPYCNELANPEDFTLE